MLPLFPLCWVFFFLIINRCCTLSNALFRIDRCDHVGFVLAFVYVVFYVYWLANIVPSLHPWDEPHLVMVYALFNVLLDAVCQYFGQRAAWVPECPCPWDNVRSVSCSEKITLPFKHWISRSGSFLASLSSLKRCSWGSFPLNFRAVVIHRREKVLHIYFDYCWQSCISFSIHSECLS